ncbi:protein CPR-5 isoform X2 [Punica granatum]|uniref:Protein CPR-5 isoform X2 n=1 Tax=Punica granatum TaxID=22663 RepID=A0A6P8CUV2_PUNGR|nr:protein CPR-5 isoform X2 [Punica granatum]
MEEEASSPAPRPAEPAPVVESDCPPSTSSSRPVARKPSKKKKTRKTGACPAEGGPSGSSSSPARAVAYRRRAPRLALGIARRHASEAEAIALPLGMSLAAVVAQVLEKQDVAREKMSIDYISQICTSAVRESLTNVFGDKFSGFADNFEKSFGSTLRTLRLINDSSSQRAVGTSFRRTLRTFGLINDSSSQTAAGSPTLAQGGCPGNSCIRDDCEETLQNFEDVQDSQLNYPEISSHVPTNQLACVTRSKSGPIIQQPMYSTFEKSVIEQTRSNNLKTLELSLSIKKMKLKEAELALSYDANHLERSKLAMGISKASFKSEKFKTQLKDVRHAELLKKCADCLVAGLLFMSMALACGAYVFSYKRISEATASCAPLTQSKSWWVPGPVASFNSGLDMLKCQIQVLSRMLFGILMILAIAYLLLQRSSCSNQTMPVTFLLLLLGVACGFAGKLCVDTLGGSGFHWLLVWEVLCLVHFFANMFTSVLFLVLHGPVDAALEPKGRAVLIPYWTRRILFYAMVVLFLPLLCGLIPFGSASEWKDHISRKIEGLFVNDDGFS